MKVSIIIPTFNRKNLLKETLDSILTQTYTDFELIIVDNCSKDRTDEFVKSCKDRRIRYFQNQNNGIIAVNLNFGIEKAQGEYIALCDDDDLWFPTKLEKQVAILESQKDVALVCTNGIHFDENGDHGLFITKKRKTPYMTQAEVLVRNMIIQSSTLFRKSTLESAGGPLNPSPDYFSAEEFELWLRMLKTERFYMIEEPLVKYRTHGGVYRSKGLVGYKICKKIVDDLHRKKYINSKNYALFTMRHYLFSATEITGLTGIYRKLKLNFI
jgi:teichuronic acid biosynthesis glycosyltransferase TuaG